MQIKALEHEFGLPLFIRNKRNVTLTQAGRLLLKDAQITLQHSERTAFLAKQLANGAAGSLRIGYVASALYSGILPRILRKMRRVMPNVLLDVDELHPSGQYPALMERKIDVSFGPTLTLSPPAELCQHKIASYPIKLALPTDHSLASMQCIPPEALIHESFIGYMGSHDASGTRLTQFLLGFEPNTHYRANNPQMGLGLVEAGLGVMLVADLMVPLDERYVVLRDIQGISAELDTTMSWRADEDEEVVLNVIKLAMNQDPACTQDVTDSTRAP
jgi:DNA-binding transcriptional LysR family regulator